MARSETTLDPTSTETTYPPLNVPKEVAQDIWIVDGGPIQVMGLPLPLRMTVLRLGNGDLLLHSPIQHSEHLQHALERLGRIRHLIAPDSAHWFFLLTWQQACPNALTWGAPGLRSRAQVKKVGLRIDRDLETTPSAEWADEIEQVIVPGGFGFAEVDFFHRASRTLVLTDLVLNLEPAKLPPLARQLARLIGATAPDGKAPIYLRLVIGLKREPATRAAVQMIAWQPQRVIFTHGRWFDQDGTAALKRSLAWLLPK